MQQLGDSLKAVVQPLIAIMFAATACYTFIIGRLNPDQWLGLATAVIAFYFAGKVAETATANAQRRGAQRSTDVNVQQADNVNVERGL